MANDPAPSEAGTRAAQGTVDLVIGKSTDKYYKWQQIPAWVLGGAAILGGAALIAFPKHQTTNAWAAVIVGLFLAVVLSYRSAFTLNDDPGSRGSGGTGPGGGGSGGGGPGSGATGSGSGPDAGETGPDVTGAENPTQASLIPPDPPPSATKPTPGGTS